MKAEGEFLNASVLIVDDSKLDRFFVRKLLEYLGVNVDEAVSGRECLRAVRNTAYDVILMDFMMPSLNGVETLKQIRGGVDNRNESTPIVALVSPDDPSEGRYCVDNGFENYLEKPVDFKQLIAALIMYLPDSFRKELNIPSGGAKNTVQTQNEEGPAKKPAENEIITKLRQVDGIDVDSGISLCGSEDGYLTAIGIFYNSLDVKADEIENFYKNKDYSNYTIKVHALKSSGNLIGAEKLRADAKALEDAGNNADYQKIENETMALLEYYRGFKEKLSFMGSDDEDKPPADEKSIADAYAALLEFSEAMDFDLANMVVESMKEFKLPAEDKKKFEEIAKKLTNLDWDGIREIINQK